MELTKNTINSALIFFREELKFVFDVSELEQTLQIVFFHYFKINRVELSLNKEDFFSETNFEKLIHIINELKSKKPLAHIIGEWEFCDLVFKVNKHTLIPRPETEELIRLIVKENIKQNKLSILDVGTGTGCIAIALKHNLISTNITAIDVSEKALLIAKENALLNKVDVKFSLMDILNPIKMTGKFNVIVSNPPYITLKEKELMDDNVLSFEPHLALFVANNNPLLFYNAIADFALNHLEENGRLYFEINEYYGEEVKLMLINKNFKNVNIVKDINERDRIVSCNS